MGLLTACSSPTENPPPQTGLRGSLSGVQSASLSVGSARSAQSACSAAQIRIQPEQGEATTAEVAPDCTFVVAVPPGWSYLQLLDESAQPTALMAFEDPTRFTVGDGPIPLTSFFQLAQGEIHDLGALKLIELDGRTVALPAFAPILSDRDGNRIPDSAELNYQIGQDADGDFAPDSREGPCARPSAETLYGRLDVVLSDTNRTDEEIQGFREQAELLPGNFTIIEGGYQRGPFPARGWWIVAGDPRNPDHVFSTDDQGLFTLRDIPQTVAIARVYKDLDDPYPMVNIPLCRLFSAPEQVDDNTALVHRRIHPAPCSMNTDAPMSCATGSSQRGLHAEHHDHLKAHGIGQTQRGVRCAPGDNSIACCLDYDGNVGAQDRPGNAYAHYVTYIGSTCWRYVDAGCCINEGGTIWERVSSNFGSRQLTSCHANHRSRNCQNIELTSRGLVLSADESVRAQRNPNTNPESITVRCGERLPLFSHNNTCANSDKITLANPDCGTLSPSGILLNVNTSGSHIADRTYTFTAPSIACVNSVTLTSRGMSRVVTVTVQCDDPGTDAGVADLSEPLPDGGPQPGDAGPDIDLGAPDLGPGMMCDRLLIRNADDLAQAQSCTDVAGGVDISVSAEPLDVALPSLRTVGGHLSFIQSPNVSALRLPALTNVGEELTVAGTLNLQSLELDSLRAVGGTLRIFGAAVTRFAFPALTQVGQDLILDGNTLLTEIELNALTEVAEDLSVQLNDALTRLAMPALQSVGGAPTTPTPLPRFQLRRLPQLSTLELSSLQTVFGFLEIEDNAALSQVSLPQLARVHASVRIYQNAALDNVNLPLLSQSIDLQISRNARLTSLSAPALTTLEGALEIEGNDQLGSLSLPALMQTGTGAGLGGDIIVGNNDVLSAVSLPMLSSSGSLRIGNNPAMGSFTAPVLLSAGDVRFDLNGSLSIIEFPALVGTVGFVRFSQNTSLGGIYMDGITEAGWLEVLGHASLSEAAFRSLATIVNDLSVRGNTSMNVIRLGNLSTVGGSADMSANAALPQCMVECIRNNVTVGSNAFSATGNNLQAPCNGATPNCN